MRNVKARFDESPMSEYFWNHSHVLRFAIDHLSFIDHIDKRERSFILGITFYDPIASSPSRSIDAC